MRIPGIKTLKRFSRWARSRITGGALILGYHRVIAGVGDEYQIGVTPEHFAEHLDILRTHANPIHLRDLVSCIRQGTVPPRAVAITFDDGYADNFLNAFPLLHQRQIPVTMFVCTDFLGKSFWWDELAWSINSAAILPDSLHLDLHGKHFEWRSADSSRSELIALLQRRLSSLNSEERVAALATIQNWSTASPFDLTTHRALTSEELVRLANSDLVEIGSHTRTHPVLNTISVEEQADEIVGSRKILEQLLQRPISGFSYPNGASSVQTSNMVRDAGFTYGCISDSGLAKKTDTIFNLPRVWPKDWNGEKFLKFIKFWSPT